MFDGIKPMSNDAGGYLGALVVGAFVAYLTSLPSDEQKGLHRTIFTTHEGSVISDLCDLKDDKERFYKSRNECATSGNYNDCMAVKLDGVSYAFFGDDGEYSKSLKYIDFWKNFENSEPSSMQCALRYFNADKDDFK